MENIVDHNNLEANKICRIDNVYYNDTNAIRIVLYFDENDSLKYQRNYFVSGELSGYYDVDSKTRIAFYPTGEVSSYIL